MNRASKPDNRADRLIDALLDGDLSHSQAREALSSLHDDPRACQELGRLRFAVSKLRAPVDSPDLSESILSGVQSRRGFLQRKGRRMVTVGRVAVAAGVVAAVGLGSFVQRHAPEWRLDEPQPAPVSMMVRSSSLSPEEQPAVVDQAVETIRATLASPVSRLSLSPRFRPEQSLHFDTLRTETPLPGAAQSPPTALALGAPELQTLASLAASRTAAQPSDPAAVPNTTASPFIGRFGPLLVILRETPTTVESERSADED
ncbi:MAG: hypothetical protein IPJ41_05175 [Phycisphaerales bacterium]|nr:hypothetical protein [Phycisphaerales bacterium]